MSFNLFEALKGILMKEKYTVDADYSQFAVNLYLSKYKQYILVLDKIMCLKLSNQAHFDYLKKNTGYGIPRKQEIVEKEVEPIIKYIMQFYECSRLDAKDYLMFMSEEEKANLKEYYEGDLLWQKY